MKVNQEFLKAFLKSIRRGKINKFLKLIFTIFFIYFSFLIGKDLFLFYLKQKEIIKLQYSGISFSYEKGNLILKANEIQFQKPDLRVKTSKLELSLKVWESLKELKPDFTYIKMDKLLVNRLVKRKNKYFPKFVLSLPFRVDTFSVKRFRYLDPTMNIEGSSIFIGKEKFHIGRIEGDIQNKKFILKPLEGKVIDNTLEFSDLEVHYDQFKLLGKGKIKKDLTEVTFNAFLRGKELKVSFNLEKIGKNLETKGIADFKEFKKISFSLKGKLDKEFSLSKGKLIYKKIEADLFGKLNLHEFSLKGKINGKEIRTDFITARGILGTFSIRGNYKKPILKWNIKGKWLDSFLISLKNVSTFGSYHDDKLTLKVSSKLIDVALYTNKGNGKGNFKLKNFDINALKPFLAEKEKYGSWIPSVVLSGEGKFKVNNYNLASYSGNFTVDNFFFRGFSASGNLELRGDKRALSYSLSLFSSKEQLTSVGDIDFKQFTIDAYFWGENLKFSSIDFLKKLKLKGSVDCEGKLWGSLKNPEGEFSYISENFSYHGISLGNVKGKVTLQDFYLNVFGKSEKEKFSLETLRIHLKKPLEITLKGNVKRMDVSSLRRLINLPITLRGDVTGKFSIYSPNIKIPETISFSAIVKEFNGNFSIDKISGVVKKVSGSILYNSKKLSLDFVGNGKTLRAGDVQLENGKINLTLKDEKLHVLLKNFSFEPLKKSSVSGNIAVILDKGELKGSVKVSGDYTKEDLFFGIALNLSLRGKLDNFTTKLDGNLFVKHPYLEKVLKFKLSGKVEEPENLGSISIKRDNEEVKLLLSGDKRNLVGVLRNIGLKLPAGEVLIKMAFVNLDLKKLDGDIALPAFDVKPVSFYRLYSVSGLYIKLKNGEPEISGCRLSYIDGWIELSNLKLENKKIEGKFLSQSGVKGLLYLTDLKNEIKYIKGTIDFSGSFEYEKELKYSVDFSSNRIDTRIDFILEKLSLINLKGKLQNGKLSSIFAEINAGDGNIVVNGGQEKGIVVSIADVSAGQLGLWKSLISGNVIFKGKSINGKLNLTKIKFLLPKEKKEKHQKKLPTIPVNVSVDLYFSDAVAIKGELFYLKILPKLSLKTINKKPVISGSFYVIDGRIDYMGKEFKVIYGTGVIDNLLEQKGNIDILATSYISGYYIYMHIKGTFDSFKLYLSSDPPLTKEQILNLIMTGASPEQVEASSELFPAVQMAYYATSYLFKPIEKQFKEVLKLENFSIEPYITRYGETVAKITLVKRLTKRVRIIGCETTGQRPEYGGSIQVFLTDKYYIEGKFNSYYGPELGVGFEINVR